MFTFSKLRQVYYRFGASTFNYSQIEVSLKEEGIYKYENASHYFMALK